MILESEVLNGACTGGRHSGSTTRAAHQGHQGGRGRVPEGVAACSCLPRVHDPPQHWRGKYWASRRSRAHWGSGRAALQPSEKHTRRAALLLLALFACPRSPAPCTLQEGRCMPRSVNAPPHWGPRSCRPRRCHWKAAAATLAAFRCTFPTRVFPNGPTHPLLQAYVVFDTREQAEGACSKDKVRRCLLRRSRLCAAAAPPAQAHSPPSAPPCRTSSAQNLGRGMFVSASRRMPPRPTCRAWRGRPRQEGRAAAHCCCCGGAAAAVAAAAVLAGCAEGRAAHVVHCCSC